MLSSSLPQMCPNKNISLILDDKQETKQQLAKESSSSSKSEADEERPYLRVKMATGIILKRRKRDDCSERSQSVSSNSSVRGNYSILSYQIGCYSNLYTSKILSSYGKLQLLFKQNVEIKLIFSASEEGFSSKRFHQLCDLYTGTLIICLTQTNKILGGYTSLSWKQNYDKSKTYYKTDEKYDTFMFSWDRKQKYFLAKSRNNRAICCFNGFGPSFGYDLQIGNDTFANANTSIGFPSNYFAIQKNQTPSRFQVFGTSKNEIKLKDYEVYQIIKKQQRKSRNAGRTGLLTARQQLCININKRLNQTHEMVLENQDII